MIARKLTVIALGGLILGGLAAPGPAAAFKASNGYTVEATGGRSFTIPYSRGKSGVPGYWCAAGDYVAGALGLRSGTRIYRLSPPPVRGTGIRFSLDPDGAVASGLTVFGSPDAGLSAALARQQCRVFDDDDNDSFGW
jgi:hypothetical protein